MRGYFSEQQVAQVQQATDIVRLISEYLPLKRAGRSYKALCPFHHEKTPSFIVNPQRQIYKCFGCGAGGNVFGFLMHKEGISFPEAVRMLAERAGIKLEERREDRKRTQTREKLFEINSWAAELYHRRLLSPAGKTVRSYLSSRQIEPATIKRFKLGSAPDAWDELLKQGARQGYPPALLERAGLVISRESGSGYYDRFRGRLLFSIFDGRGRIIGFGGRTLKKEDVVKYINSPATPLFDKGRSLYGLNFARSAITRRRQVAVVEGYTDCLMAHQMGIDWVVATLGTALTRGHLRLLRRFTDEVILVFDADAAGLRAAERTMEMFLREELEVRIAVLEEGLDPCEFLVRRGKQAFLDKLDSGLPLFSQLLENALAKLQSGPTRGTTMVDELLRQLLSCSNPVQRDRMLRQMAERLNLRYESLHARLGRLKAGGSAPSVAEEQQTGIGTQREADLLRVLLARPDLAARVMKEIPLEAFEQPEARLIAEHIYGQYHQTGGLDLQRLLTVLSEPGLDKNVVQISEDRPADFDFGELLESCLTAFRTRRQRQSIRAIRSRLKALRASGSEREANELLSQLKALKKTN